MKHANWESRLDEIMTRAAIRLQEKIQWAHSRGLLPAYFKRIGFAENLDVTLLRAATLLDLQDWAAVMLAHKLRQARKTGCLKELLQQLDMLELLQPLAVEADSWSKKSSLRLIQGENTQAATTARKTAVVLPMFRVIK